MNCVRTKKDPKYQKVEKSDWKKKVGKSLDLLDLGLANALKWVSRNTKIKIKLGTIFAGIGFLVLLNLCVLIILHAVL